jgi:stearoyl-CoA desaturase (delta-9 desaturase)
MTAKSTTTPTTPTRAATAARDSKRIDPLVLSTYVVLHLSVLGVFFTGVTWRALAIFAATFAFRMLAVGIVYHRYFSHRAFKTSRPMQFVLALLGTLCFQKGPLWWARTHRDHHRYADTPKDLHSPKLQGLFYSHFVWFQEERHQDTDYARIDDYARFPELRVLDDWRVYFPINLVAVAGLGMAFGLEGVVWGGSVSTVVCYQLAHAIQSISHYGGGYRRCPSRDESRNHIAIGLLTLGEWHNNHHYAPRSARQGFAWWEIDVQYGVLRVLAAMGLIWDLRFPRDLEARAKDWRGGERTVVGGSSEDPALDPGEARG